MKRVLAVFAFLIFALCGCSLQTTMDLEYLQEEAFQKGYEQGKADAAAESFDEAEYESAYNAGYEEGYSAGYADGNIVSENISAADTSEREESAESSSVSDDAVYDYVLNTNSRKFHKPDCSSVGDIKEKNKGYFTGTRAEIVSEGYEPCGRCNP